MTKNNLITIKMSFKIRKKLILNGTKAECDTLFLLRVPQTGIYSVETNGLSPKSRSCAWRRGVPFLVPFNPN